MSLINLLGKKGIIALIIPQTLPVLKGSSNP